MFSGKMLVWLGCVLLVFALTVPGSASSIAITGNSSHGILDGSGSWNVTSSLGGTTPFSYNGGSSSVLSLGNGVVEQLACGSNSLCVVGDGTQIDFLFQIPASQIKNGTVTFNNFTFGSLAGVQLLSCNTSSSNAPGFLCSSGGLGLGVTVTLNGTTLVFSGFPSGVSSFTFLLPYNNTSATLSGPQLAGLVTPEPGTMLLFGTGVLAGIIQRFRRKA